MRIELKGRKAIVTGSTAGIGRAIAEGLARAGASVVVNGRTQERMDMAPREMRALLPQAELHGVAADIATPEGCAALIAQAPDADVLINNAGTARLRLSGMSAPLVGERHVWLPPSELERSWHGGIVGQLPDLQ